MQTQLTRSVLFTLACTAASATGVAQQAEDLLFTTLRPELTLAPLTSALHQVGPEDVMVVTPPGPAAGYTAEKFAPLDTWLALVGDHDLDNKYVESSLWGKVDALFMARNRNRTVRDLYFSPAMDTTSALSVAPGTAQMGDVIRVATGGQFELFLLENRVRAAFNINGRINIDAVDYDATGHAEQNPQPGGSGMIYFSLEQDHQMTVSCGGAVINGVIRDGAILAVQVLGFDALGAVLGMPVLVAREAHVSAMVAASGIANHTGAAVNSIRDTDGLTLDDRTGAGLFNNVCGTFPNLLFSGERLTGGGVVSTNAGGTIAQVNGAPLGSAVVTDGDLVGLQPAAGSLNSLELERKLCHFVTESPTPDSPSGTISTIEIGGADPGAPLWLLVSASVAGCPAGGLPGFLPFSNPCFPELIAPLAPGVLALPVAAADGTQQFSFAVPAVASDVCLVWQAVTVTGGVPALSTPIVIHYAP